MSFADIAFEKVLEQMGKEGKSTYFSSEECESGSYKLIKEKYEYTQKNTDNIDEHIIGNTVPEIIQNLKDYYYKKKIEQKKEDEIRKKKNAMLYQLLGKIEGSGIEVVADREEFYRVLISKAPLQKMVNESSYQQEDKKVTEESIDKEIAKLDKALQDYLSTPEKKLCDFVVERVNKMYEKPSDMYKSVYMDKRVYSNIVSNKVKNPKFESCVQLAFGLELNIDETTELFRLAGSALSDSMYHRIVKFYIENKEYKISALNESLDKIGIKPIGCE